MIILHFKSPVNQTHTLLLLCMLNLADLYIIFVWFPFSNPCLSLKGGWLFQRMGKEKEELYSKHINNTFSKSGSEHNHCNILSN